MVELTIDGKKIKVKEGANILQAALSNGIEIPHLCYDPRLERFGGCRMCLVEIEGRRWPVAACATPVKNGMTVKTDTPALRKSRQTTLELLLIHHPLDCPTCAKAGECSLQDMVFGYGKTKTRFKRLRHHSPADVRGPLIELDANLCILCGKCVRICAEHQGRGALGLIGRGFDTVVQPAFGEVLECDFCGQCVDICPTGAIANKTFKYTARAWYLNETVNICPFCSVGCTLTLGIMEGRIVRSRGKQGTGLTDGNLCGRGRFGFDFMYSENRLKAPLIKKDGLFVEVSWDEALKAVSLRLREIWVESGIEAIGALGSPRCTLESNYILQKFMRKVIGTGNIDSSAHFGYNLVQDVFERTFGVREIPVRFNAPLEKELLFVIESDITSTHPVYGLNFLKAKRQGAELIVADCKETKLTWHSTENLQIKPGTGACLINGIMHIIMKQGLYNREHLAQIAGFEALETMISDYTPEKVEAITGIGQNQLVSVASKIAHAKSRLLSMTLNASENSKGKDTVQAAANLILLLYEEPGSLQVPPEYCNTMGMLKVGIRPDEGGKTARDMLYLQGALRALYIMGEDPLVSFPDTNTVHQTLKSLDFLIVQDIAMTDTAKLAHVILPASGWAEKDGSFLNMSGIRQGIKKVVDAKGHALPDIQIIRNLGLLMGASVCARNYSDTQKEINEILTASPKSSAQKVFHPTPFDIRESKDASFPYTLVIRDSLQHSGTMSTRSKSIDLVLSDAFLEINEADAAKEGFEDASHVRVISNRGETILKVRLTSDIREGIVCTNTHFPHGRVNTLTSLPEDDGVSGICFVRVEKV
ncbi:MAG TPA: molybdopterin-dependent oxidoreductase [Thermodesulfovibrionia bacterium]|nr:molybdopterin-dependent oxidoreductase [Thermodesulfovibrionia bacterium]